MAGLGKKIFGAALQGVGNSMVQQAAADSAGRAARASA